MSEDKSYKDALDCKECIGERMKDRFHAKGLLHLNELMRFEGDLSLSNNPKCCKVLVYTSDLATENDAIDVVDANIEKGVHYIVLYFKDSCTNDEYDRIKEKYGEYNLVNLSEYEDYKNSFDGLLAEKLGFDIMIYQDEKGNLKGYFAVDFVPTNRPQRAFHDPNCKEKCNYSKETEPFYKEFSLNITKQLYEEGLNIQKKFLEEKKQKHGRS